MTTNVLHGAGLTYYFRPLHALKKKRNCTSYRKAFPDPCPYRQRFCKTVNKTTVPFKLNIWEGVINSLFLSCCCCKQHQNEKKKPRVAVKLAMKLDNVLYIEFPLIATHEMQLKIVHKINGVFKSYVYTTLNVSKWFKDVCELLTVIEAENYFLFLGRLPSTALTIMSHKHGQ